MNLRPIAKAHRRSETRDIVQPIIRALNRIDGVRVTRNANLGPVVPWHKRLDPSARPILAGIGTGSADIVGIVSVQWSHLAARPDVETIGRAIALEVKLPAADGLRAGRIGPDQRRWLSVFRRFGGFAAVVHSTEEAVAAVERCRTGASE